MLARKTKVALLPKYDSRKSFYGKAEIEELEIRGGDKIYLLYSYKTLVSAIIQEKDNTKWLYLNNNINKELLTSQTTLRHIKEFYKQFYENETKTKAELLKMAILKNFDYLRVRDSQSKISVDIADNRNYYLTTCPETMATFKGMGTKQRLKEDSNGKYLFTSSKYGYSNYYFYYFRGV